MRKPFMLFAAAALIAAQASATYIVVLRDGTKYKAKTKWTAGTNGKALITLENGLSMQVDPALIDEAKSDQATRSGLGDATILGQQPVENGGRAQQSTLGSSIKLRKLSSNETPATPTPAKPSSTAPKPATQSAAAPATPAATAAGGIGEEVVEKFVSAYENVGIYEHKITTSGHTLHAELTADSEEKVFNALSATSLLIVHNGFIANAQIDSVELVMKQTAGGSAGNFKMSRQDAEALDKKTLTQQDYFVRNVVLP
jgi:hypothetical protein